MSHSASNSSAPASDVFAPGHLGELTQIVPPEMIDAALATAGGEEQRLRRLPSRVVVYVLLAGALFAGQGWRHVFSRLTAGLPGPVVRPSGAAITEAMRRVGPKSLRELFTFFVGSAVTCAHQRVRFAGRLVVAIDGTQIPVADTEANRVMFPKPRGGPNGEAGYPMIRLVAIVTAGTRDVIEAVFGTDKIGELTYAERVATALRPGMLLLGDRNFATYKFFTTVAGTGAEFLIRAKKGNGAMNLPILTRLRDGSFLSVAAGVRVRVIDAAVTITTEASTRTGEYRLITTLLNPAEAPAKQLMGLYHERWEIETAYCELKSTILGGRVLRSRYPTGVEQEVWALLTVYQVLRTAMADALLDTPDIDPDRASFTTALRTARDQVIQAAGIIAATTVDLVGCIGAALRADLMPDRRTRTRPRVIKRAISKYRAKGRAIDRRTYPATLTTRILTPDPDD
ncbi:IS4 family transposase [Pseudarthrobacter raffinosi]|uniref:IS4 family transposase n=1 Tax=Pseudarthrobacter raffinosi TaxID=2953651 RepID=UPI00208E461F|nr:IS4 family transposase [Pseudarthrobacter sp. MDT3-9]MCO4251894.1 IS4 family transposase [Pseudarthrobacter sp. MDT3-9]